MGLSQEGLLCLVVLSVHLLVAIVIALALEVRYGLFGDLRFDAMPGDMMILDRGCQHLFCREMYVTATFEDLVDEQELETFPQMAALVDDPKEPMNDSQLQFPEFDMRLNRFRFLHKRSFDLYSLNDVPSVNPNKTRNIMYNYQDDLKSGHHLHQPFYLLKGSSVSLQLCGTASRKRTSGFWVHIIKGFSKFDQWEREHVDMPGSHCGPKLCLLSVFVPVSKAGCHGNTFPNKTVNLIATDSENYLFVFYLPEHGASEGSLVSINVKYAIKHTTYDMSATRGPLCHHMLNCSAKPNGPLLIDMAYYTSGAMLTSSDYVTLVYSCRPNVLIYVGLFFAVPVIILCTGAIVFYCIHQEREQKLKAPHLLGGASSINYGAIDGLSTDEDSGQASEGEDNGHINPSPSNKFLV